MRRLLVVAIAGILAFVAASLPGAAAGALNEDATARANYQTFIKDMEDYAVAIDEVADSVAGADRVNLANHLGLALALTLNEISRVDSLPRTPECASNIDIKYARWLGTTAMVYAAMYVNLTGFEEYVIPEPLMDIQRRTFTAFSNGLELSKKECKV